jgi:signal transduction histidine kinase
MHGTIFVRKGEKSIRSEADLKGKEVIVMRGDYAHEYMVSQNIPAKLILTTDYENAMKLLSSGKHDAIFCQYLMGLQLIKNLNIKNVVSVATKREKSLKPRAMRLAGFEQKFCFAVPEGRADLLSRLNEGLSIVHANGTYQDLYDKWFSPILPKPAVPLLTVIKSMLFTLLPIMFFVAVIGVWYLRQEVRRKTQSLRIEIKEREQAEAELKKSRDALDRRVVERTVELEKTYAQLLHAEKLSAIGKLTASIAHEFNNPLYGIKNVIEGIKRNFTLDDEYRELLDLALSECDRVRDLIKNLQDFNRPSSDVKEEVNIHVLLDEMVLMVKKDYKTAHVVIKKQYAPDLPSVHAVSDQMKQVFLNLLTNAKDAITVDGGTVTITTEKLGNRISVRISDTGSGIAENVLPHIFEPFFTTKPAIKGTGLGLSVSYGIIKGHNGDIQVDSVPGRGTTFSILLPVHEETDDATKHIAR